MTFELAIARLALASLVCGAISNLSLAPLSFDFVVLPMVHLTVGDPGSVVLIAVSGALAGFVWWWLNFEVAPSENDLQ